MSDLSFISLVVALLLDRASDGSAATFVEGGSRRGWSGVERLLAVVGDQFAGDQDAQVALTAVQAHAPGGTSNLAVAVRRHAEIDPAFLAEIRYLVVDAYADPATAAVLPDPSPRL